MGTGRLRPERPEAQALNATVMEAIAGAAKAYADGGFFVVIDCVVGPWLLTPFRRAGLPLHYVVLRVSSALAVARCQTRGGDTLTDPRLIADLNRQFRELGELEHHAMDVDELLPEDAAAAVEAALTSNSFRIGS